LKVTGIVMLFPAVTNGVEEEFENLRSPAEVLNSTAGIGVAALLATGRVTGDGAMPVGVAESGLKVTWTVHDCPGAREKYWKP
jgi:hypothetical protein